MQLHIVPYPKEVIFRTGYAEASAPIREKETDCLPKEAYKLWITPQEICIEGDKAGIFYGKMTLKQLHISSKDKLPCLEIYDEPRFAYRGFMLDSSRHFLPREDVLRIIDVLAFFKINRLHWHIMDESDGFGQGISSDTAQIAGHGRMRMDARGSQRQ